MNLPSGDRAEVAPEKLRNYLLSSQHPVDRFKAQFFRGLGYDQENWALLADQLRAIARAGDAQELESPFGRRFSIVANVVGPSGRSAWIISIWVLEGNDSNPRFVTAYPAE